MLQPLVSILIPTHQRKALLLSALESVWKNQEFPYEILVGDNASSDGSAEACQEFFRRSPPKGMLHAAVLQKVALVSMVENWNTLLASAQGKYVRLLCDDDALLEGALSREVAALEKFPEAGLCASARLELANRFFILPEKTRRDFGTLRCFAEEAKVLRPSQSLSAMIRKENIFGSPSAVLFRRAVFASFSADFQYAVDWAAWISICEKYSAIFLPDPGCWFRLHDGNLTSRFVWEGIDIAEGFRLRWRSLALLERISGHSLAAERIYLALALWLRLSRRAAKLLLAGRIGELHGILRKTRLSIAEETKKSLLKS